MVPVCPVQTISIINEFATIPLAMLDAVLMNMEHHVSLCLQVEGKQLQHPL
jgi:hypothetical protein